MNVAEITFIHKYLVKYFQDKDDPISPEGIKNNSLLESSAARPFMSLGQEDAYKGVFNKAAALFHSLINNHCFHNGNKRVGLLATMSFLGENGYWLTLASDDELLEFTRMAAAHELCEERNDELRFISDWFRSKSRRRNVAENTLKLHELKEILAGFDYEFGATNKKGRAIEILRDGKVVTKILAKGSKGREDYDKLYIKKLRKKLKLSAEYGVDSYVFYGERGFGNNLCKFLDIRHKVMRELAKL